jgi:hypothetical protein
MSDTSLRELLGAMRSHLARGEQDVAARDAADRMFREAFHRLRARDFVPNEVMRTMGDALVALVGDDQWTVAREYVEFAIALLEGRVALTT